MRSKVKDTDIKKLTYYFFNYITNKNYQYILIQVILKWVKSHQEFTCLLYWIRDYKRLKICKN